LRKIALEEHFLPAGFEDYWAPTVADVPPAVRGRLLERLRDFGEQRLGAMDGGGIGHAVLSVAGPGVQAEPDARIACRRACEANDYLAQQIARRPTHYAGFAHLPLQDPVAAASELERAVRDLGFCGAMINGHTRGQYLDDPALAPFWERAEALGVPIYLHPADPLTPYPTLAGYNALARATWGWGVETASHALRLVFGGVFDRFPGATLVLGHLGETLPFLLWRLDSRAKLYGVKLARRPSEYIRQNMMVTTSGMCSREPLVCSIEALGRGRVMFAADYPFEAIDDAAAFLDAVEIDEGTRADISFNNAARLLRLASI
jgi:2,3-dihydroxybenzoate decarboxylase